MTIYHEGRKTPSADPKDPDSTVWYGFSFELLEGEQLTSATWLIDGTPAAVGDTVDGLTLEATEFTSIDSIAKAQFSGGTLANRYRVTCRYSTTVTESDDRSMFIRIIQL